MGVEPPLSGLLTLRSRTAACDSGPHFWARLRFSVVGPDPLSFAAAAQDDFQPPFGFLGELEWIQ